VLEQFFDQQKEYTCTVLGWWGIALTIWHAFGPTPFWLLGQKPSKV
jgi:hypothetical protein